MANTTKPTIEILDSGGTASGAGSGSDHRYEVKSEYLCDAVATFPSSVSTIYRFSLSDYGFSGYDDYNFVKGGVDDCWGKATSVGYNYKGSYVPFATKASSTLPTPYASDMGSFDVVELRQFSPFDATACLINDSSSTTTTIKVGWNQTKSKCYVGRYSTTYDYVDGDGVWLFLQAPGGGGGGCDPSYSPLSGGNQPGGGGGGSGASALVYLDCRGLYDAHNGTNAPYFFIEIGAYGTGGAQSSTGDADGTSGGSITVTSRYYQTGSGIAVDNQFLSLGGGSGGGKGIWNWNTSDSNLGTGGVAFSKTTDSFAKVLGMYNGASGHIGTKGLTTSPAPGPGDDISTSSGSIVFDNSKFYLKRNLTFDGVDYTFGNGSEYQYVVSTTPNGLFAYAGGGGGSICVPVASDSRKQIPATYLPGMGGKGACIGSGQVSDDGGVGAVFILKSPIS